MPVRFTQKVVLETVAATWSPGSLDADEIIDTLMTEYPGQVYGIAFHVYESAGSKELEIPGITELILALDDWSFGVPMGAVSRSPNSHPDGQDELIMICTHWDHSTQTLNPLGQDTRADCGLSIETDISGDTITVTVYVGFNESFLQELEENLFLTVLLIEDDVTGYSQAGYAGAYTHNRVARHILTPLGPIFGGADKSVLNAQLSPLGDVKDFD